MNKVCRGDGKALAKHIEMPKQAACKQLQAAFSLVTQLDVMAVLALHTVLMGDVRLGQYTVTHVHLAFDLAHARPILVVQTLGHFAFGIHIALISGGIF